MEPEVAKVDSEAGKKFKTEDVLNPVGIHFRRSHLFSIFGFESRKVCTIAQGGIELIPLVIAVGKKGSLVAKSANGGSIKNIWGEIRRGKIVLNFIIEGQPVEFSSVVESFPAKLFPDLIHVGTLPAAGDNEGSLVLDAFNLVGEGLGAFMEEDVTILQVRADMHLVGEIKDGPSYHRTKVFHEG